MANKKINELDVRASLSLSDLMVVGDPSSGYAYKTTLTDLKTLISTEADTLDTVTDRGATTSNLITTGGYRISNLAVFSNDCVYTYISNHCGSSGRIGFGFTNTVTPTASDAVFDIYQGPAIAPDNLFTFRHTLANSTGNNTNYNIINIVTAINQTGGSNGIVRGVYYNPTLTNVIGTHYAYESAAGKIKISDLAGTGTRMVVADSTGVLSTQAIPSGGGGTTIYSGNGILAGDRVVTSNGNSLTILGGKEFVVNDQTSLELKTSTTGKQVSLYLTNTNTTTGKTYQISSETDGTFRIRDTTQTAFIRNSSGQIGIGNVAPVGSATITLSSYTNSLGILKITGALGVIDGNGLELFFTSNTSYAYSFDRSGNIWRNLEFGALSTTFRSNGSTSMTLTAAGRLLLGTTSDSGLYQLDVFGPVRLYPRGAINGGFEFTFNDVYNIFHSNTVTYFSGGNLLMVGGTNMTLLGNNKNENLSQILIGYPSWQTGLSSASAKVDIRSSTQGFLGPRMTTAQKNAISSPAAGLQVYDTDTNKLCCYNGSTWNDLF
jgi:hypothetical protein